MDTAHGYKSRPNIPAIWLGNQPEVLKSRSIEFTLGRHIKISGKLNAIFFRSRFQEGIQGSVYSAPDIFK